MKILLTDEEIQEEGLLVFCTKDYECRNIAKAQLKKVAGWILEHKETSLFNKHGNVYIPPKEFEALLKEVGDD